MEAGVRQLGAAKEHVDEIATVEGDAFELRRREVRAFKDSFGNRVKSAFLQGSELAWANGRGFLLSAMGGR